jgi:hypothetical protein
MVPSRHSALKPRRPNRKCAKNGRQGELSASTAEYSQVRPLPASVPVLHASWLGSSSAFPRDPSARQASRSSKRQPEAFSGARHDNLPREDEVPGPFALIGADNYFAEVNWPGQFSWSS